jgi:predicted aminopeptidase
VKPTSNYTDYVQLDRPAATWVVSACAPLKFEPKEWRFPIVGSFNYLGWFDLDSAKKHAERLKVQGYDVDVRGARAFSTLGWFKDAVLSSMITEGDEALGDLVNVILHESVHATVYIKGQSYFNESLASFVADELTPVYLARTRGKDSTPYKAYQQSEETSNQRQRAFRQAYEKLEKLYGSDASDEAKLAEKAKVLTELKDSLKLKKDVNNATLIQFKTYGVGTPEFSALFRSCGHIWNSFLKALGKLSPNSFTSSLQEDLAPVILPLARDGCAGLNPQ